MTNFPTKPIEDSELPGVVVMALSVSQLGELVEELRTRLAVQDRVNDCLFRILKGFGDLYLELTDRAADRRHLDRAILKAEREAARLRLPLWFWRPEPGLTLTQQVERRVKLLKEDRKSLDDAWDLCLEFQQDCAHECLPEEAYRQIIRAIYGVR
ncbi:MAG TPA: hypothetical protein PK250_10005 [Syntrophobacter fumaroxidans]|nr:hypothetical protein [Syntrophobacter fumaroxidans]